MDRYPPRALPTKCADHIYGLGSSSSSHPSRGIEMNSSHMPFRPFGLQEGIGHCTCWCDGNEIRQYMYTDDSNTHSRSNYGGVDRSFPYRSSLRRSLELNSDTYKRQKSSMSYVALISHAILNNPEEKSTLSDIYRYIEEAFPECIVNKVGWKNTVRHNLSLHECFVKGELAKNGKSCYWRIHPKYKSKFSKGEFKRRPSKDEVDPLQTEDHSKREVVIKAEPISQGQNESSSAGITVSTPKSIPSYIFSERPTSSVTSSCISPQLENFPTASKSPSFPSDRVMDYPPLGHTPRSLATIGYHPGLFYFPPYYPLSYSVRSGLYY